MKVYFISGIAADSRIFKYIELPDGFEAVFINYIKPFKDESLSVYGFYVANTYHSQRGSPSCDYPCSRNQ